MQGSFRTCCWVKLAWTENGVALAFPETTGMTTGWVEPCGKEGKARSAPNTDELDSSLRL